MDELKNKLIDLFTKTAETYGFAFAQDESKDDWAYRFADLLQQPLSMTLTREFSRAQIVTCLMTAENDRLAMHGPDYPWAPYYAEHFLTRFAPVEKKKENRLSLYYYPECPFCRRVLHAIEATGTDVELRHVWENPNFRKELMAARGRGTVPVLRISRGDGNDRWLPESADIVRYLHDLAKAA